MRGVATDEPSTDSLMLPRRPWRPLVTATAAIGAALMAGAVALGTVPTFLVTGLAMVLLAGGWVLLLGLPSPRGTTAVLAGRASSSWAVGCSPRRRARCCSPERWLWR